MPLKVVLDGAVLKRVGLDRTNFERSKRKDGSDHSDCVDVSLRAARARFRITLEVNTMRSTIILTTALAVSTAILGACSGTATPTTPVKPETKPVATPIAVQPASPVTAPPVSPTVAPPVKPSDAKDHKTTDVKPGAEVKEIKPANSATLKK